MAESAKFITLENLEEKGSAALARQAAYIDRLPTRIVESFRWYTGGDIYGTHHDLNEALREGQEVPRELRVHLRNMDRAFADAPTLKKGITLYRGLDRGDVFNDAAFASTTLKPHIALNFTNMADCCIMKITVPPGAKVLPISLVSSMPGEGEVLLDRGAKWYITGEAMTKWGADMNMRVLFVNYMPRSSIDITNAHLLL